MLHSRRQWLRRQVWGWCSLTGLGSGCVLAVPHNLPRMDTLRLPDPGQGRASKLVVMLPGAYSRPPEFVEAGFPQALQTSGMAADVCIVDSHIGYYNDRSIVRRLREEIVLPARAQSYRQIWLLGTSLGGFGALAYAVRHGGEIDGVVALAPYLGPRRLLQEIQEAGGAAAWSASGPAQRPPDTSDEIDREIWRAYSGPAASRPAPPVYLGYGRGDRFADAHRRFAELLPAARVKTAEGGHDWPAWRALWQVWLAQAPI